VSVTVPRYAAGPVRRTVMGIEVSTSALARASIGTTHKRCGILRTTHQVAGFVCRRSFQNRTVTFTGFPDRATVVES
jgi:hypothetical protein